MRWRIIVREYQHSLFSYNKLCSTCFLLTQQLLKAESWVRHTSTLLIHKYGRFLPIKQIWFKQMETMFATMSMKYTGFELMFTLLISKIYLPHNAKYILIVCTYEIWEGRGTIFGHRVYLTIYQVKVPRKIEPHLLLLNDERFNLRSANIRPEAQLDMKAGGFWLGGAAPVFE